MNRDNLRKVHYKKLIKFNDISMKMEYEKDVGYFHCFIRSKDESVVAVVEKEDGEVFDCFLESINFKKTFKK